MLGLLLQWLVLERFADLKHSHVACWCDNTPTVAWATKLLATKAIKAARLICILALRMLTCQASPMTTHHISGKHNQMADFASRSFQTYPEQKLFLTEFHHRFPLPQNNSWICCHLPNALIGQALSTLSTPTSTLGSWWRLSQRGSVTGGTGPSFFHPISIRTFKTWCQQNDCWSCTFSLDGSRKASLDEDNRSRLVASKPHSAPSARPSNWLGMTTHCTALALRHTTQHLPCKRKHTAEKTLFHSNSSQSPSMSPTTFTSPPGTPPAVT